MAPVAQAAAAASPWTWSPHLDVWLLIALLSVGYLAALRWLAPAGRQPIDGGRSAGSQPIDGDGSAEPPNERPVIPAATARQKTLFFLGVGTVWVGSDWPMHDLAEGYLYSAHMIQHMLFTFVAPPLLLSGTPKWLLRRLLAPPKVMALMRLLTKPLVALLMFNALVALTHWPALVDASLRSDPLHFSLHTVLFVSAGLMWWPVIGPLPEMPRLSDPAKLLYLFGQSILPTVPASFLTFASRPIYEFYETVPRLWGLSALTDQLIAGLIMKIGGGLLLWSVIAVIFFRWHAREESEVVDELSWDDFESELQVLGLRNSHIEDGGTQT